MTSHVDARSKDHNIEPEGTLPVIANRLLAAAIKRLTAASDAAGAREPVN